MQFEHTPLSSRDISNPALESHLADFAGYVSKGPELPDNGGALIDHIRRTFIQMSFHSEDHEGLTNWATAANAIMFWPDGSVRDPHHRALFHPDPAQIDPDAAVPRFNDPSVRKARSIATVTDLGIAHTDWLPELASENEVTLPEAGSIIDRATSLLAAAVRAETAREGSPMPCEQVEQVLPRALRALTPDEQAWMANDSPDSQTITNFGWRYECVPVLLWALGIEPTLAVPETICDVPGTTRTVLETDWDAVEPQLTLRSEAEVLDQADLYYRIHWAIVDSRVNSTPPVVGVEHGAVVERRHALEWLIDSHNTPWDDVALNT